MRVQNKQTNKLVVSTKSTQTIITDMLYTHNIIKELAD